MAPLRLGLVMAALLALVLTVGFIEQAPWATDLWPWEASRLSYLFLASILAAIALPVLWIGISGELAAVRAGAVDLAVTYGGMLVYVIALAGDPGQPALGAYVAVFAVALVAMLVILARSRPIPWRDSRPMPTPVRASFAAFALVLVAVGVALLFGAEILPWPLGSESSVMFGLIFLGAAAYFLYGFFDPRWANGKGQLIGFLAYDLVLIGPFVDRFGEVSGGELVSLMVYTAFLLYSGWLGIYYLFVDARTRLEIA